ncbi:MAG: hypothetical protein HQK64_08490 [Desulfamplus sp.]|nr:hypothetical protein [Desulfamplus sp.]MBF0242500.1 hypothetical protein [Desulfamplus sp.]
MKNKNGQKIRTTIVGLMVFLVTALPISAVAIELTDYLDPNYQYHDAEFGLQFNMSDGNQDQISYNGIASLLYEMEYSTLPLKWDANLNVDTDFSRGGDENDSSRKNLYIDGDTTVKKYLGDYTGPFVYGGLVLGVRDLEGSEDDDPYTKVSAGLGYGRITTATPLMEAIRCVEDLTKYGLIAGEVKDEVYLKLADIIARESEYISRYSRREYEKYWYEDMEIVFKEAGILRNETLGALGIIRIQDILTDERVLKRKHGWEAGVQLDYLISDYSGNDDDPGMGIYYEYAKPYGLKWQFIDRVSYSTVLVDGEFGDAAHKITNSLELNYEMTDKIDWENIWKLDIIWESDSDRDDTYLNLVDTGLRFYISNTVDAKAGLQFTHKDQGDNPDDKIDSKLYFQVIYTIF